MSRRWRDNIVLDPYCTTWIGPGRGLTSELAADGDCDGYLSSCMGAEARRIHDTREHV
jgi:hypothetical protein